MLCAGLFTGCTSNADTMPQPQATTGTATTAPMTTSAPSTNEGTQGTMPMPTTTTTNEPATVGAASTVADAQRLSSRVEGEVEKLSEVDEADTVVIGNIALVGVSYDAQYQGGMTDRLKEMITDRVEMTDRTITAVHVTDDDMLRKAIAELNDMMDDAGTSFEALQTRALEIAAKLTGGGMTQPDTNNQTAT